MPGCLRNPETERIPLLGASLRGTRRIVRNLVGRFGIVVHGSDCHHQPLRLQAVAQTDATALEKVCFWGNTPNARIDPLHIVEYSCLCVNCALLYAVYPHRSSSAFAIRSNRTASIRLCSRGAPGRSVRRAGCRPTESPPPIGTPGAAVRQAQVQHVTAPVVGEWQRYHPQRRIGTEQQAVELAAGPPPCDGPVEHRWGPFKRKPPACGDAV